MSNGFGSIDTLLQDKGHGASQGSGTSKKPTVSTADVEKTFEEKMGEIALKEREVEAMRFAQKIGMPHIDLEQFPISPEALRLVPKKQAAEAQAVCFFYSQDEVRVGAVDPRSNDAQELLYQLQERTHANGSMYVISTRSLEKVLKLYDTLPTVEPITKDVTIKAEDLEKVQGDVRDFASLQKLLNESETTDLVTYVMGAAFTLNASDVHIEAEEEQIVVRFRIDGILHDAATLPKSAFKKLISRIKLLASLKINITDKPQDGRFTIKLPEGDVDIRVSTIPTVHGESIVMRLLKQSKAGIGLDKLGIADLAYKTLTEQIHRPNGMIITTGPTGSGKTTTLYAVMQMLNKPGVKILTLEDPVEYKLEGINQSQIDLGKGYTFAKGLRSMLRQDPDIAMVGEIRDLETADTAIQAALTGHLILSTLHTNSAAGAIPRFLSMGVKPFLLAPALNAVIGQRLVRRLNDDLKQKTTLTPEQEKRVTDIIASMPESVRAEVEQMPRTFYTAPEYDDDGNMGYKGRVGIYEIFVMTPEIEQMILSGEVSEYDIEQAAIRGGMITMVQDGIIKALQGMTSVEEVFRVIE